MKKKLETQGRYYPGEQKKYTKNKLKKLTDGPVSKKRIRLSCPDTMDRLLESPKHNHYRFCIGIERLGDQERPYNIIKRRMDWTTKRSRLI